MDGSTSPKGIRVSGLCLQPMLCPTLHTVDTGQVLVVSDQFDGVPAFHRLSLVYEQVALQARAVPGSASTHSIPPRHQLLTAFWDRKRGVPIGRESEPGERAYCHRAHPGMRPCLHNALPPSQAPRASASATATWACTCGTCPSSSTCQ